MKYTGNTDPSDGPRPGTLKFADIVNNRWKFTNLGIWANRPMRGTNPPRLSVHATGRAIDIGYKPENSALAGKVAAWLADNHVALGIEEVHDYAGASKANTEKWGRGFRCERRELGGKPGWKDWSETDNGGTPGGKWLHVELTPAMADDPRRFVNAWKRISSTAPPPLP